MFIYFIIISLGHILIKNFDIKDLALNFGMYFVLVAFYVLEITYLNNSWITGLLNVFVVVGAFTHVLGSLIFFLMITIMNSLKQNKRDMGVGDD